MNLEPRIRKIVTVTEDAASGDQVWTRICCRSNRFPQVILITHVDGMRDAFDRVIRMSYDVESRVTTVRDDTPELLDVAV